MVSAFETSGWAREEAERLATLIDVFLQLPAPPDPHRVFPDYTRLRDRLAHAVEKNGPEEIELRFLELYTHVHMNEAPYSRSERRRMDAAGGYWNHAGGLSPILKAGPWIDAGTVSADFGAGNGLQGLLLQVLYPHARTVQIEISARMKDIGEGLREWLGVPGDRVEWAVDDVLDVPAVGYSFIYMYRPVRPDGPGREFYTRFAREVESETEPPVIFSIADCLRDFLSDRYEVFHGDGHLTCFRARPDPAGPVDAGNSLKPSRQRTQLTMKAIGLTKYLPITDNASLVDVELPKPEAEGHDLLVSVRAISVNPVDVKVRAPKDGVEDPPRVLGWDAAGVVEAIGPDVTLFAPGDEVFYAGSITRPGTNSELHLVDERIVGSKPKSLSFAEAAALPLTSITAWEALFDRMGISRDGSAAGQSLLVLGGAGGVGSIAIQVAKQVARLNVIATASRNESRAWCLELGADHVVNHREDIPAQLQAIGSGQVDYVLCLNDTDGHWNTMSEVVAPQGHICSIVETSAPVDIRPLMKKSATFSWELMFTRSMFGTPDMIEQHDLLNEVATLVDAGKVRTTSAEVIGPINAANLRRAHAQVETGRTIGKVVLESWS